MLEKLKIAGEHNLLLQGPAGKMEVIFTVPEQPHPQLIALLGHPHSLQGGTMNNKVVTTLVRACRELNIPSIRFNFRGVGQSEGIYNDGVGESDDMLFLANLCRQQNAELRLIFAGFSFGSFVAYRAASQCPHQLLLTIAPAVNHCDYNEFKTPPNPWVIVQGDNDEVVPASLVHEFANSSSPPLPVISYADTGHFFHGKLIELKASIIEIIQAQVEL